MADRKDWERLFREADKNGNGYLTAGELARAMKRIGYPGTESKIKAYLCAADQSGDRQLSVQEFMDTMEQAPVEFHIAALLHTVFSHFDQSGDGEISPQELRSAMKQLGKNLSDAELRQLMDRMDTDHSGTVNIKEFLEGVTKRMF